MNSNEKKRAADEQCDGTGSKRLRPRPSNGSPIKLIATEQDLNARSVHPSKDHWSFSECETLRELVGLEGGNESSATATIDFIVIGSYQVDFAFLIDEIPELVSVPRVVVFFGVAETTPEPWRRLVMEQKNVLDLITLNPSDQPSSTTNPLPHKIPFGVHHSKFFLVGFSDGRLRVVVHTANLRYPDVYLKAQAAYREDFWLKSTTNTTTSSPFEETLLDYLDTYKFMKSRVWKAGESPTFLRHVIKRYDFSSATAVLVPSTPGYHSLTGREKRGHLKVRECIEQFCRDEDSTEASEAQSVVCQFSSLGSLSEKYLIEEFQVSFGVSKAKTTQQTKPKLKIVYPTVSEIRNSIEGYRGGCSVPGPNRNVSKPFLRPLYCRWSSPQNRVQDLHKPSNVPHIKSYFQLEENHKKSGEREYAVLRYIVITSHNLSKAAWGEVQNSARYGGRRLFVRHWELGVFMSTDLLNSDQVLVLKSHGGTLDEGICGVPLPYDFDPAPYRDDDEPWAVDIRYKIPDVHGRLSAVD